jgi:hypothetical protein
VEIVYYDRVPCKYFHQRETREVTGAPPYLICLSFGLTLNGGPDVSLVLFVCCILHPQLVKAELSTIANYSFAREVLHFLPFPNRRLTFTLFLLLPSFPPFLVGIYVSFKSVLLAWCLVHSR